MSFRLLELVCFAFYMGGLGPISTRTCILTHIDPLRPHTGATVDPVDPEAKREPRRSRFRFRFPTGRSLRILLLLLLLHLLLLPTAKSLLPTACYFPLLPTTTYNSYSYYCYYYYHFY